MTLSIRLAGFFVLATALSFGDEAAVAVSSPAAGDTPAVVATHVFYNDSKWDGENAAANADDDLAIALDKSALRPNQTATFDNYVSYLKGVNGIMVDVENLPTTELDAGDFSFKVGNDGTPGSWSAAAAPTSVTVRPGAGTDGSDRITIIWAEADAVKKQWLQVTVLASGDVGLEQDYVFHYGNAIGEAGDRKDAATPDAMVTSGDLITARDNVTTAEGAALTHVCDFNRDKTVDAGDLIIARDNVTGSSTQLGLIVPASVAPIANSDSVATAEDVPVPILLSATDPDGDDNALTYSYADPKNGTLSGNAPDLVYTPNTGFVGSDSFVFTAHDGYQDSAPAEITITVELGAGELRLAAATRKTAYVVWGAVPGASTYVVTRTHADGSNPVVFDVDGSVTSVVDGHPDEPMSPLTPEISYRYVVEARDATDALLNTSNLVHRLAEADGRPEELRDVDEDEIDDRNYQVVDTDADGIDDRWELAYAGDLTTFAAETDADEDGLSDLMEFLLRATPMRKWTPDDGDELKLRVQTIGGGR